MSKKVQKKKGRFDHYKRGTTDQCYTFLAESKEDAILYLKKTNQDLGKLVEVE